eukprot:6473438-Amphidinium_carterae.1
MLWAHVCSNIARKSSPACAMPFCGNPAACQKALKRTTEFWRACFWASPVGMRHPGFNAASQIDWAGATAFDLVC